MRVAWYDRTGPAHEVLQLGDWPDPQPGPGEVRVRVAVSGANPSDWKTRSGVRPLMFPRVIPHSDGAGTIDRVGPGVPAERIGERVWLWNGQWKRPHGTAAEYIALPSEQAVRLPDAVSFDAGASLGIPALTAYRAVTIDGPVAGQTVLVTGGAGAVGLYAVQFARALGAARVLATVSTPEKAKLALSAGAEAAIDYRTEPVAERVLALTGGRGVDRVVEVDLAADAPLLPKILAENGLCAVYGSDAQEIRMDFGPMLFRGIALRFFLVYALAAGPRRQAIADITRWMEEGRIAHPPVRHFPLSAIAEAHEAMEKGAIIGKALLTL